MIAALPAMSDNASEPPNRPAILFLDFDGVLHPDQAYMHPTRGVVLKTANLPPEYDHLDLFCFLPGLLTVLDEFPEVHIVLSTSWVKVLGLEVTKDWLPSAMKDRIIGSTYDCAQTPNWQQASRYWQIVDCINRMKLAGPWLAIDDDAQGWPDAERHHLVRTDEIDGLNAPGILGMLRQRLGEFEKR